MFFKQFYLGCLAQASYLIGSEGEAAVVDPRRDVDEYLEEAKAQGLTIRYVIETHLHADFVSGHRELAERTGAEIVFGEKAEAAFPHRAVREGDEFRIGRVLLRVLETHLHADFVSGHRELAERTGAEIVFGAKAEAAFPHRAVTDADEIRLGRLALRFIETPGHTPESVTIVAPVRSASSRWPLTKSAWRCVSTTYLIARPCAFASSRYSSTSRRGSTTAASPSEPIMYDAWARQPR